MVIHTQRDGNIVEFWDDILEEEIRKEMRRQIQEGTECMFCSVRMFGTHAYTGDNGETVYADYIEPENMVDYCKEHCCIGKQKYENRIREMVENITKKKKNIQEYGIHN